MQASVNRSADVLTFRHLTAIRAVNSMALYIVLCENRYLWFFSLFFGFVSWKICARSCTLMSHARKHDFSSGYHTVHFLDFIFYMRGYLLVQFWIIYIFWGLSCNCNKLDFFQRKHLCFFFFNCSAEAAPKMKRSCNAMYSCDEKELFKVLKGRTEYRKKRKGICRC